MDYDPIYSVVVRDTTFTLTKSQIETDSPNYFTMCFLGDFSEAQTRVLLLSRDPDLFKIIIDHLCGYTVLPLNENRLPAHMPPSQALSNLRADAAFYQLDGLILACDALLSQNRPVKRGKYMALVGESPQNFANGGLAFSLETYNYYTTLISHEQLSNGPFSMLTRVDNVSFPESLSQIQTMAVLGGIIAQTLGPNHYEWQLLGWYSDADHDDELDIPRFLIVAERVSVTAGRI